MVESIADTVLHELLGKIHIVGNIVERHFGLYHPELGEVARSVTVLGAESRAEGVYRSESRGSELAFELAAHGKSRGLPEEVLAVIHGTLFGPRKLFEGQGGHLEHCAGTLAVAFGDKRRVEVVEAFFLKELMDSESQGAAHSQDGAEGGGAGTQVRFLAQELEGVALLLQGVACGVGSAVYLKGVGLHLAGLALAGAFYKTACDVYARAGGHRFELLLGELREVKHYLEVANRRAVVECHELHVLVASAGTHPALDAHFGAYQGRVEDMGNLCAFHNYGLFKRAHLEVVYLFLGKVTPAASRQILLGKAGKVYTVELGHMVTEALEDTAHDAIAAGVNLDTGLIAVGFGSIADGVGVDRAVLKLYAVGNTLHIVFRYIAVAPHVVNLFLHELGVGELRGKVAVVGKQKHAGSVAVKTSHGIYALVACAFDEIHHSKTSVGVVAGGNAVFGLVEQDIALALKCHNLFIILHNVAVGNLGAKLGHYLAVDLHQALLNELIGLAARAKAGVTHIFVQANLLVGSGEWHFIFHRLGTRSEALAASRESAALLAILIVAALTRTVIIAALAGTVVVTTLTRTVAVATLTGIIVILARAVAVAALTRTIVVLAGAIAITALTGTIVILARTIAVATLARAVVILARLIRTLVSLIFALALRCRIFGSV